MSATVTKIEVSPVSPNIGAVIGGIRLSEELGPESIAAIREALLAHRVVFFRDQFLESANQLRSVTKAHPTLPGTEESASLFDLDSLTGSSANHWHTDVTFVQQPPTY